MNTDGFMQRFVILGDGPPVWAELMALSRQCQFSGSQVRDANIVATMRAHGETRLLTFNEADFRRFAGIIQVVAP
jgi:predicted nucleic acid-binding protein